MSAAELARATGMTKAAVSRLLDGQRDGKLESWQAIARATNTRFDWWDRGDGEPEQELDEETLPLGLRELVRSSPKGTYSAVELQRAALFRAFRGEDLTAEGWSKYLSRLRDVDLLAASDVRVVTDDPVARKKRGGRER